VIYAPELNPRYGAINYQHVNVTLSDVNPFSAEYPNPVPRNARFGGSLYPYYSGYPR
jgi:hypothetical protein